MAANIVSLGDSLLALQLLRGLLRGLLFAQSMLKTTFLQRPVTKNAVDL